MKLIQSNTAVQSAVPVFGARQGGYIPNTERIITQIIRPASASASDILGVLNKIKSRNGDVTVYKPSNALIVTDSGTNIRRMMKIVRELDIPAEGEKIWVVRLRYANGKDVEKLLGQLFNSKGKKTTQTFKPARSRSVSSSRSRSGDDFDTISASKIVTDNTSNSLIIVASESSFRKINMLIKRLDVEGTGVDQRIHVYYLENADASELSKTLSNLASGSSKSKSKNASTTAALFEGEVKISADKSTNSLVIVASTQDYLSIRRVIKRLDIPRRQVFVEATIMEVTINDSLNLGLGLHAGKIVGSGLLESLIYGATNTGADSITGGLPGAGIGLGAIGAPIEGSDTLTGLPAEVPGLGIKIDAQKANSDINVLSSPHILTTDNEEAEIIVGENLPFPGQRVPAAANAAAGQLGGVFAQLAVPIQRQDVALKLKLTPHVNDSDVVRLELSQEVSDVIAEDYGGNGNGPATSKRSIKTTIVVRDQQTVVIGGLIRDKDTRSETKIPLLGDLPIIGNFFKSVNNDKTKVNLLLVLTPYVIRDQSDLRRIFTKRMEERREFIERYTPFEPHEAKHEVDYLHKRGLLAEINHTGIRLEEESRLIKQAELESAEPIEPVDLLDGMNTAPESTSSGTPGSSLPAGGSTPPPSNIPPPPPTPRSSTSPRTSSTSTPQG